jgi:hypothetical protein
MPRRGDQGGRSSSHDKRSASEDEVSSSHDERSASEDEASSSHVERSASGDEAFSSRDERSASGDEEFSSHDERAASEEIESSSHVERSTSGDGRCRRVARSGRREFRGGQCSVIAGTKGCGRATRAIRGNDGAFPSRRASVGMPRGGEAGQPAAPGRQ